jgi:endonuclease VIII
MPEGHTIHRIARDQMQRLARQRVKVTSPQGRFETESNQLSGKTLKSVEAHGKHLYYFFAGNQVLHVHLGLYGKFRSFEAPPPEPRGAVRVRVVGKEHAFDLVGPNQCEIFTSQQLLESKARLGDDPLRSDANPDRVWARLQKSKKPIGALLLDQSIIAGIGNIYRAEILFLLGIHPNRASCSLDRTTFDHLWRTSVELLEVGVKYNRIITVRRSDAEKPLSRLNPEERLWVYKKPHCARCDGPVESWLLANRPIYACSQCQT